jgi:hypothetical protein
MCRTVAQHIRCDLDSRDSRDPRPIATREHPRIAPARPEAFRRTRPPDRREPPARTKKRATAPEGTVAQPFRPEERYLTGNSSRIPPQNW